jgi:hypothetical protein
VDEDKVVEFDLWQPVTGVSDDFGVIMEEDVMDGSNGTIHLPPMKFTRRDKVDLKLRCSMNTFIQSSIGKFHL